MVSTKDEIRFNSQAIEALGLGEVTHFTLWWDENFETVGLKPCKEETRYAVPLRIASKDGSARMPTRRFFQSINAEGAYSRVRVTPIWNEKRDMVLIKLGK